MEKLKRHYELKKIKSLLCAEESREITRTSRMGAAALGYMAVEEMLTIIDTLTQKHFYKSMTAQHDTSLWQDVYKILDESENKIYVKLQLSPDKKKRLLFSLKEIAGRIRA
jgi:motility quorum-sensing regulator/GCU-specific mRNA interferase toxin